MVGAMTPLRITAHLTSAAAGNAPFMLDGVILWGECARLGAQTVEGWIPEEEALTIPLPFARVTLPDGRWWYACSGACPTTEERQQRQSFVNRRPDHDALMRLTDAKAVDERAGPDKMLRRPRYSYPFWMRMEWTCIGDKAAIVAALSHVQGIGQGVPQGFGMVRWPDGWHVEDDPNGPTLEEYRTNARLRPLPADVTPLPAVRNVERVAMPLRAPYWNRVGTEPCWKVSEKA